MIAHRLKKPWIVHLYNARTRCLRPSHKMFYRYGGRGIKCLLTPGDIEALWKRDKADELLRPSLDRIDSNKDYVFDNCQFIELRENLSRAALKMPKSSEHERRQFATGAAT